MQGERTTEIAIIGAGIVGLSIAMRLRDRGHEVTILDPNPPGSGASFGNASAIAPHAISPCMTPDVLKSLPSLLFSKTSPFSIRPLYLPSLTGWLLRGLREGFAGPAQRNMECLALLQSDAKEAWMEVVNTVGLQDLLLQKGVLYTYQTAEGLKAAQAAIDTRRRYGIPQDVLSSQEVAQLEPNLPPTAGAVWHSGSMSLLDAGEATTRMARQILAMGGQISAEKIERLERDNRGVILHGSKGKFHAKRVIIAAGAHSAELARQAGDRVPLVAHRGYHIEFDMENAPVSRPVHRTHLGYYMTPLKGRMRCAGTLELASNDATPSEARYAQIEKGTRETFAGLPPVARKWMGLRPALPDSLPVLGASRKGSDVLYAFGHGHVGLTLGPATAKIIERMVSGAALPDAYNVFSAQRF